MLNFPMYVVKGERAFSSKRSILVFAKSISTSARFLFFVNFQRSLSLSWPWRGLSNAHSASSSHPSVHHSLESSARSPLCLYIFFFLVSILCISFPRMVLDLSCSFCQKGTRVSLVCQTLQYFGLTLFNQTILPFMGVVDCSTTNPFSLTDFSPWDLEGLIISAKGVCVI
jgi:hypothetical protein